MTTTLVGPPLHRELSYMVAVNKAVLAASPRHAEGPLLSPEERALLVAAYEDEEVPEHFAARILAARPVTCQHPNTTSWRRIERTVNYSRESGQCDDCREFLILTHRADGSETFRPMTDEEYERESPDPRTVVTSPWDER